MLNFSIDLCLATDGGNLNVIVVVVVDVVVIVVLVVVVLVNVAVVVDDIVGHCHSRRFGLCH